MSPETVALRDYMSELSEKAYCAGWMSGLEFALWKAVREGPMCYGRIQIEDEHIMRLRQLSERCQGWIRSDDAHEEVGVSIEEWNRLYENEHDQHPLD